MFAQTDVRSLVEGSIMDLIGAIRMAIHEGS